MQIVERGIMAQLHQQFTSVHAANVAMAPLRARLNEKLFQLLRGSRTSAFAAVDVSAWHSLLLQHYEIGHFKNR